MADPFIGEIRMFGFDFAPSGWAFCDGQLLPISQNTQLFAIIGTTFGGDGRVTFGLPNFQGIAPMQQGQDPVLTIRNWGDKGGAAFVTLTVNELPPHTHAPMAAGASNSATPANNVWAAGQKGSGSSYAPSAANNVNMNVQVDATGSGLAHNNIPPYLVVNFCIALQGIYPPRS